ncbi:unnamed protein product [Lepeophtheirus salmonis]|uniref:(salmon louse) hypothetical protein n=1 Tax=Lepeophtheirus salmonis TaxID=72036 RepID=A0A7R8H4U5_LEPSM|nr:unnamed protein product [Lepeophtheirus salmonis]CAF2851748.1 unnamed protein product [Lepeophtheirus salmonis]
MLEQQCHKLDFNRTKGMLGITHLHPNVREELLLRAAHRRKVSLCLEAAGVSPIYLQLNYQQQKLNYPKWWTSCKLIPLVRTKSMILDFPSTFSDTTGDRDSIPKAAELYRLHNAIKEKLATDSYPDKVLMLTLVPDSLLRSYAAQQFCVSEYII